MKNKAILFFAFMVLLSCKKNNGGVTVSDALTNCPLNSTCSDSYYDDAAFVNINQLAPGNSRLFWFKSVKTDTCHATSQLYFETPLSDNDFDISSSQIVAGQNTAFNVAAFNLASACYPFTGNVGPVGGEIKGKRIDATHWLINALVIFSSPGDTLKVDQYFTLAKLP